MIYKVPFNPNHSVILQKKKQDSGRRKDYGRLNSHSVWGKMPLAAGFRTA